MPRWKRWVWPAEAHRLVRRVLNLLEGVDPRFNLDARWDEVSIEEMMACLALTNLGGEALQQAGAGDDATKELYRVLFLRLEGLVRSDLVGRWNLLHEKGGFLGGLHPFRSQTLEFCQDGTLVYRRPDAEPKTERFEIAVAGESVFQPSWESGQVCSAESPAALPRSSLQSGLQGRDTHRPGAIRPGSDGVSAP